MFTCCEFWHKSIFFCPICSVVFVTHSTLTYSWTPETKLAIISEAEACPISTQHVNSEVRAKHACLNMTVIVSALLALKPITAGNTSPVCQLQKLWEAIVSAQRHNCKLLADARVADSAAPIWIAPLSGIIKFKLKGWKTSERAGCLFLLAQFDNQDHSCLFLT